MCYYQKREMRDLPHPVRAACQMTNTIQLVTTSIKPDDSASLKAGKVIRTHLIERLETQLDKKLILVRAPAGYGKTTFLRQCWDAFQEKDISFVWVTFAAGDDNTRRFISVLVGACRDTGIDAEEFSEPHSTKTPAETLIAEFAGRLSSDTRDLLFFIDEYQNAECEKNDHLLKIFLQQTSKNIRVIIATRNEPACGVAKMRLDDELAEFTKSDLTFDVDATYKLFERDGLSRTDAENLCAKTEGWPAALGLAKLSIKDGKRSIDFVNSFTGDLPVVVNYFAQEVFAGLPEDAQTFLSETSILSYFDASLADEVLLRHDSEHMLRRLASMGGLIIPDEPPRGRYRHHRLFADYLRSYLHTVQSADEIKEFHERASDYFIRNGEPLLALEHAIDAGDLARIVGVLDKPEFGLFWLTVDFTAFMRVMRYIDQHLPEKTFRLLPAYAFYLIKAGRFEDADKALRLAEKKFGDQKKPLDIEITKYARLDRFLIKAIYQVYTDDKNSEALVRNLEEARWKDDIGNAMYLGVLNNALGVLFYREGRIDDADLAFDLSIGHFTEAQSQFSIIHNIMHRMMISILKGDMPAARNFYEDAGNFHRQYLSDDAILTAVINANVSELLYQMGDLESADATFDAARSVIVSGGDYWVELLSCAYRIEAKLEYAKKGLDAAYDLLGQGIDLAQKHKYKRLEQGLIAQKIHLATVANDISAADKIAKWTHYKLNVLKYEPLPRCGWREDAELAFALIRLDIARGRSAKALSALDEFDKNFQPKNLKLIELKSGALRALALFVDGQAQEASGLLRELIETGENLGLRSFYLEEGLLAQDLLDEAARRFSKTKRAETFNEAMLEWLIASSSYLPPDKRLKAPELTPQQSKILTLLARGLDRTDIADQADTTTHNVQYHLKRMFELFGVTSSMRLVAEALRLKLVERAAAPRLEQAM
jgi:LuxR family transcriptional regulator, maltose regulon positive regulatory protein